MFFGSFLLYLKTIAPTVTFWDSGELIAASYRLGIPHQPGYPIFCIMGRLFSFIPLGSVAFRLNLLSASFSSLAVVVVYFTILQVLRGRKGGGLFALPLAALLALVLALVRSFWSQAVVTEVYALNAFLVSMLVFLYVKAHSDGLGAARYIALSGFLFGIGVVNHMSMVLYLPALALSWALLPGAARAKAGWAVVALSLMLLGLSLYVYLPVRSLAGVEPNIGHPDTPGNFWWVLKWGQYIRHARDSLASAASLLENIRLTDMRVIAGGSAAVFFAWRLLKSDWRLYLPLIVYLAAYSLGISTQVMGGAEEIRFGLAAKFFIPSFILIMILIGAAIRDLPGTYGGRTLSLVFTLALAVSAALLLYRNYYPNDYSRNYMAYDYAANSLKSAGNKGVLFTWGDNGVFPLWYLQMVEHYRDDAVLVHSPLMTYDWYLWDLKKKLGARAVFMEPYFLGENVFRVLKAAGPDRAVAYDYSSTRFLDLDMAKLKARGLVYFEGGSPPGDPWPWYVYRGVGDPTVYKGGMEKNIIAIYEYEWKIKGLPGLPWDGQPK